MWFVKKFIAILLICAAVCLAQEKVKIDGLKGEWVVRDTFELRYLADDRVRAAYESAKGEKIRRENSCLNVLERSTIIGLIAYAEIRKSDIVWGIIDEMAKHNFIREKDIINLLDARIKKYNNEYSVNIFITDEDKRQIKECCEINEKYRFLDE